MDQSIFFLEEGLRLNFLVSLTQTFFAFMAVRKVEETFLVLHLTPLRKRFWHS